jgi:DNA-binding response OmpR family regulator
MQAVLLVDDDPAMELALRPFFEGPELRFDWAADGYGAIDHIRRRSYDAIILDLVLRAGLNGFGVLNFIEMEQPELISRVYLITGMSEQTVMRAAPDLLPRLFRKPFDAAALVGAVLAGLQRHPVPRPPSPPTVLVADDDIPTAQAMRTVIEAAGWRVRMAADGREALESIVDGGLDAIVLDLIMPGIDGFAVLEYLRLHHPELLPCTLLVSGLPQMVRERFDTSDTGGILDKPLRPELLLEKLERCARK